MSARLNLIAGWREATVFTDEQGSRLADGGGVTDEAWANAAMHYDEEQLTALVCQIGIINGFNRMTVSTRQPAGDYQPGKIG